mgnify:CR=1 FL=1
MAPDSDLTRGLDATSKEQDTHRSTAKDDIREKVISPTKISGTSFSKTLIEQLSKERDIGMAAEELPDTH